MRTMLLIGGGHAHLHILKQLQKKALSDVHTILVSPSGYHYYSGMFSGYIEGLYKLDEIRISLDQLAHRAGARFQKDRAVSVDPVKRTLRTERGDELAYDVISFDIGSMPAGLDIPGVGEYATAIKPYETIAGLPEKLDSTKQILVVGGGASGVELALAIQARRHMLKKDTTVSLVSAGELLSKSGPVVSRKITGIVKKKGIRLYLNDPVARVFSNRVHLKSGEELPYDRLLWLAGPKAPAIFSNSAGLADEKGYLPVGDKLQSVAYPNIFGAGDCITMAEFPDLDKAGVYAVKEAPILWHNLQHFLDGGELKRYKPQRSYLSILPTGGREALLQYIGLALHGSWCWQLKRKIDQTFTGKFQ